MVNLESGNTEHIPGVHLAWDTTPPHISIHTYSHQGAILISQSFYQYVFGTWVETKNTDGSHPSIHFP